MFTYLSRKSALLLMFVPVMAMLVLAGCSDDDTQVALNDRLGSVARVIGNTTMTDEVVTDGTWLAWEGRQQRLLFNDGSATIDLGAKLDPKYNLGTDNDTGWSFLRFDGRYAVFAADDVTDPAPPQLFAIDTASSKYKPVQLGSITAEQSMDYTSAAFDNGLFAIIIDNEVYYCNAANGSVVQLTSDGFNKSQLTVSGTLIAWVASSYVNVKDTGTAEAIKQLGSAGVNSFLTGKGGLIAWAQGTAVYYSTGSTASQATADGNTDSIGTVAVGNGNVAWQQGSSIVYRAAADAAKTVHTAATGISGVAADLSVGDGILAWSSDASWPAHNVHIYSFGDAADSLTTETMDSNDSPQVEISGKKVFWQVDMSYDSALHNPSTYLYSYDTAAASPAPVKVSADDYFRILNSAVASGKALWYGHDANRRIYVVNANNIRTPEAVSPASVNARQPQISDGIVVYKGMDRSREDLNPTRGGENQEIYYCELNKKGKPVTRVTNDLLEDDKPYISGKIISWFELTNDKTKFHNIATGTTTTVDSSYNYGYAARSDGRFVVWRQTGESNSQLYYLDTTSGTSDKIPLTGAEKLNKCPNINKGIVTWTAYDGSSHKVYYADLASATPTPIQVGSADIYDQVPVTDGRFIVWGGRSGGDDYPIRYYDISATTPAVVEMTAESTTGVCNPRISNGLVVFAAITYGAAPPAQSAIAAVSGDTDREIFAIKLTAKTPAVIRLTDNDLWDSNPDVANGVAIWRTGGSENNWSWTGKIAAGLRVK